MARGALSDTERHCLEAAGSTDGKRSGGLRVRFLDEEGNTQRTLAADELDAAVARVQKIHILKNRSSSEASLLLRAGSRGPPQRRYSGPDTLNNNNSLSENLNSKPPPKTESLEQGSKAQYKRDCNVYSVHQARTIASERRKSLPLTMPRLLGQRPHDSSKSSLPAEEPSGGRERRALGRLARGLGRLLRRNNSVRISEPDPVYKVAYLGNVLTGWARGESCIEKPLATLWRNYQQSTKPDVVMKLSVANSGLKGFTKEHGLTEYWAHRITYCASPPHYPRLFCWVYRHEGKKLKHELRCHAVLCTKENIAKKITEELQVKLKQALVEFKKDRICKQNARLSLANSVYENPSMPRRKILLSVGATNYRPPLERSKSAPKLGAIEELCSEEDEEEAELKDKQGDCLWADNLTVDDLYASQALDRRRAENRSPRKLSCPEGVMGRIRTISDHNVGATDAFIKILIKESQRAEANESKTSHEERESRLSAIAESNESDREDRKQPANYLVTDSDDGSVSSGCETASTATSSDEPCSLPSHFPLDEVPKESDEDNLSLSRQDFEGYSNSIHNDSPSLTDEVNLTPIGEKNAFRRRSTYPPLRDDMLSDFESKFDSLIDDLTDVDRLTLTDVDRLTLTDVDRLTLTNVDRLTLTDAETFRQTNGDNDSACSDESGYSEPVDNGKDSVIGNTIMV